MNLHNIVKIKLETSSSEELIQKLQYSSIKRGLKTLEAFLAYENLHSWIHSGYYDFKYTAVEFYEQLAKALNISSEDINSELQKQKKYQREVDKFKNCYIFVNTNFKRTTQPIFALAISESSRRIQIKAEKLVFKKDTEILAIVSDIVKAHYEQTQGVVGIWGKIVNYVYHHSDNKSYKFDIDAKEIENITVKESHATLTLKGYKSSI
ncbi:MAG: hypothetical protein U9O83_03050 [Campylobacterota bacterium]|nr:hypothetical protein [Campylobacterota bacterium]